MGTRSDAKHRQQTCRSSVIISTHRPTPTPQQRMSNSLLFSQQQKDTSETEVLTSYFCSRTQQRQCLNAKNIFLIGLTNSRQFNYLFSDFGVCVSCCASDLASSVRSTDGRTQRIWIYRKAHIFIYSNSLQSWETLAAADNNNLPRFLLSGEFMKFIQKHFMETAEFSEDEFPGSQPEWFRRDELVFNFEEEFIQRLCVRREGFNGHSRPVHRCTRMQPDGEQW